WTHKGGGTMKLSFSYYRINCSVVFSKYTKKFDGGTGILPVPDAIVIFLGRARSPTKSVHKINVFVERAGEPVPESLA
ncbi:hypothetical protein QUB75_24410, partial [Microcoleus sp. K1-B6]|uniref:hypothetical protein n=1 Tax=unclassified Microcoleus TaxID=2642155 RepID=UPI002FD6A2A8